MRIINYQLRYALPVYLVCLAIFVSSSQSQIGLPLQIPFLDKVIHFIAYAILGFLTYRACRNSVKKFIFQRAEFISMLFTILYGFSDEFHQFYVPGRQTSAEDFLADAIGAIIAVMIVSQFAKPR